MVAISIGIEMPSRINDVEVINVITGTEAMAKITQAVCEAIIVGPRIPDMAVSAIVDELTRRYPRIPVILVADAPRRGIWEHVPFADDRLHAAVVRAVEVGQLRRMLAEARDSMPVSPAGAQIAASQESSEMERTFRRGTIRDMERLMIFDRLSRLGQNRTRSAESLDISVRTLRNKLREYRDSGLMSGASAARG